MRLYTQLGHKGAKRGVNGCSARFSRKAAFFPRISAKRTVSRTLCSEGLFFSISVRLHLCSSSWHKMPTLMQKCWRFVSIAAQQLYSHA